MSLNYNLGGIKDYKTVCLDSKGNQKAITKDIIFSTMAVDLGAITEKNYFEFHRRLQIFAAAVDSDYRDLTLDVVKAHIGLTVNVSSITRLQWLRRLNKIMERESREFFYKLAAAQPKIEAEV